MERLKCTDKIKNAILLERVGEGRIMLELIKKKEEKKLAGSLAEKELPAEGCSRRNGKREESSRQKKISDDRQHYVNGLYEVTKMNAEFAVKDLPLCRTL